MIDEPLRQELIRRAMLDRMIAQRLVSEGRTHVGYHPDMEKVHADNADWLLGVYDTVGWPHRGMVGDDGAAAAMLLLQNASPRPAVQRRGLELMMEAQPKNQASPLDIAFLTDRIRVFQGKGQIFGTQLDWGTDGTLQPAPITEEAEVDRRRAAMGLGTLRAAVEETNAALAKSGEGPPVDLMERRAAFDEWARAVGWR